ncbi:hypothetical protein EDD17DRAFT_1575816 [Pisolithus thermaeus]|nr:hypothetical protein EV401DRAFT_1918323 [Pisolithus croceorrhizus]KAI6162549.1 hypothetical protein EDD17DRAFT_1575816 [Pisolithus thermaeus]
MAGQYEANLHDGSIIERIRECIFLTFLGTRSLEDLIKATENDKTELTELKQRLTDRTANINVIGTLVVSGCAAFLTTSPPTNFANWLHLFPYVCIGTAIGCAMLSVVTGLGLLIVLNVLDPKLLKKVQRNILKKVLFLMLLMMPLTFLGAAAICVFVAWIGAAWYGVIFGIKLAMTMGCLLFFFTLFMAVAVIY